MGRVFDAANCRLVPPPVEHCVIRSAASPLKSDSVATPRGDVPEQIPMEARVDALPTELKSIEFELVGDLWLRLPNGSHNIEVRVHSPGLSGWIAITGGRVRSPTCRARTASSSGRATSPCLGKQSGWSPTTVASPSPNRRPRQHFRARARGVRVTSTQARDSPSFTTRRRGSRDQVPVVASRSRA